MKVPVVSVNSVLRLYCILRHCFASPDIQLTSEVFRVRSPIIGIPSGVLRSADPLSPVPERCCVPKDYIDALRRCNACPLIVPTGKADGFPGDLFEIVDGILLPGGADVDPALYGEEPHPAIEYFDPEQDVFHIATALEAISRDLPLLGICRGEQILNVALGGTLHQDLPSLRQNLVCRHQQAKRHNATHSVLAEENSLVASLFGARFRTNSFHHQAVKTLGDGLVVTARASDGIIEAVEMKEKTFVIGVQWHPEMLVAGGDGMLPLFRRFLEAASSRRSERPVREGW